MAKLRGLSVLSTSGNEAKAETFRAAGAHAVVIDDGEIAGRVRELQEFRPMDTFPQACA